MYKIMLSLPLLFVLSGCASTPLNLVVTKPVVILPPANLMVCNLTKLPSTFKTNNEVAVLIVQQHSDNLKCHNNMNSVRNYLTQEKVTLEKK